MKYKIHRAVVIGAGTMGAGIAAHLANAGVPVTLLDIVPNKLTSEEEAKGLTLAEPSVRNRIVRDGFERALKSRPASFFTPEHAALVATGNLEDDFAAVESADWVIEVIVENLAIKRQLMQRIDAVRAPSTIVSTNTSGIPVTSIAEGLSEGFRKHFLGTHFFNPPRYLKLLEVIPTPDTLPEVTRTDMPLRRVSPGQRHSACQGHTQLHRQPHFLRHSQLPHRLRPAERLHRRGSGRRHRTAHRQPQDCHLPPF